MKKILKKIISVLGIKKVVQINMPLVENELLKNKIALISGGSSGIGASIAESFAKCGCKVILIGTNEEKLKKEVEKIGFEFAKYIVWNLYEFNTYEEKISEAVELAKVWNGKIDILVNSAGRHGQLDFWNNTYQEYDAVMDVNLKSVYFLSQKIAIYMKNNKIKGNILNVSSASALKPAWTPYEISKWGIKGLTLGLADDCIKYDIVVNSIAPGPTNTNMITEKNNKNLDWRYNPSGRMATPEEIANWAVYMVSDIGRYIVGDTLYITGGSGTININK